jgi:protein involved in polysaccharide export with SLBB domain
MQAEVRRGHGRPAGGAEHSGPGGSPARPWLRQGILAHPGRRAGLKEAVALVLATLACSGPTIKELHPGEAVPAANQEFDPAFEYQAEYRIRVGDEIRIEFLSDPEPATNASLVIVRPDGRVSLRGVDDVLAAGSTPAELDSALTERFAKLLVDPSLSVILTRFSGERIYVLGEVRAPREIVLQGPLTLLQAVASAGGFLDGAKRSDVVVVRHLGSGRLAAFKVDAKRIMTNPVMAQELALRAQDVVIVPKTRVARIGELVGQYFRNTNPALITVLTIEQIIQREREIGIFGN